MLLSKTFNLSFPPLPEPLHRCHVVVRMMVVVDRFERGDRAEKRVEMRICRIVGGPVDRSQKQLRRFILCIRLFSKQKSTVLAS